MSNLLLFPGIPTIFLCVHVTQVVFLYEDWKKLSVWSSYLFTLSALEMREKEAYKKHDDD